MVSNLDTGYNTDAQKEQQQVVSTQTRDEILDYLVGKVVDEKEIKQGRELVQLRRELKHRQEKLSNLAKQRITKDNTDDFQIKQSFLSIVRIVKKLSRFTVQLSLSKLKMALLVVSRIDRDNVFIPVKEFVNYLRTTNVQIPEFSPETLKKLKTRVKTYQPTVQKLFSQLFNFFKTSGQLAVEYAYGFQNIVSKKYPNYRQTILGALILAGCSLSTIVNQAAMPNNSKKAELLNSSKLVAVNWNVNGQVNEADKEDIKRLLASSDIKVVSNANQKAKSIKVITDIDRVSTATVSPDASLMVLNSNTIPHTVSSGESILSISKKYKVSIADLISSNPEVDLVNLRAGDALLIPNNSEVTNEEIENGTSRFYTKIPRNLIASRSISRFFRNNFDSSVSPTLPSSSGMAWPVPQSKTISSKYGPRGGGFHPGIDITAPTGTPMIATRDGVVISSGWSGGYGKCILIDHGNGVTTRYGHASSLLVTSGQQVKAGQVIGRIGSTGWSTGPHLHYEVLISGRHQNPMKYL